MDISVFLFDAAPAKATAAGNFGAQRRARKPPMRRSTIFYRHFLRFHLVRYCSRQGRHTNGTGIRYG